MQQRSSAGVTAIARYCGMSGNHLATEALLQMKVLTGSVHLTAKNLFILQD